MVGQIKNTHILIQIFLQSQINSLRLSDAYIRRKLTIIGTANGLSPGQRQDIIWTSAGMLLIQTLA